MNLLSYPQKQTPLAHVPQSSGSALNSARDIEIFRVLQRYRYLRSTFLHAFVGGRQETRFKERLRQLYHDGRYINRPRSNGSSPMRDARRSSTNSMIAALRSYESATREITPYVLAEQSRPGTNRQFAHALMICETLASIELGHVHPEMSVLSPGRRSWHEHRKTRGKQPLQ